MLLFIFLSGFLLRIASVYPDNIIVGFDQARDFADSLKIVLDRDLRIVGPVAGNNPSLHHGVLFLYYLLPPLLVSGGNPFWAAAANSFVNAAGSIILFFFATSLFKSEKAGFFAAVISAVSYYFVSYSGWLSNPTVTLFTVPAFFFSLWKYISGHKLGLVAAAFFLGLTLQFELFFLYLVPTAFIAWILIKPKLPELRLAAAGLAAFSLATLTMILTEFKFNFGTVRAIAAAAGEVGVRQPMGETLPLFVDRFWQTFSTNLWPQNQELGQAIGLGLILFLLFNRRSKPVLFLLIYLLSPFIMLLFGYHAAPWFLIGLPPAIALAAGFALSKIKPAALAGLVLILIVWQNLTAIRGIREQGQTLLEPDSAALASSQLAAIDYTYQSSGKQPFSINTVTNPLYVNAVWAYQYRWYGTQKYGYLPGWLGGEQEHPYDVLPSLAGDEKYFYLLIDQTPRIPEVHRLLAFQWADERGKLVEEKEFGGILVQKREFFKK